MSKETDRVKKEYYHGIREVVGGRERVVMFGALAVTIPEGYAYCANPSEMAHGFKTTALRIVPADDAYTIDITPYGLADVVFNLFAVVVSIYPAKKDKESDFFKYTDIVDFDHPENNIFNLPKTNDVTVTQNADIWVKYDLEHANTTGEWTSVLFEIIVRDANACFQGQIQVNTERIPDWESKVREMLSWVNAFDESIDDRHALLIEEWLYNGLSGKYDSYYGLQIPLLNGYRNDTAECTTEGIGARWRSCDDTPTSLQYGRVYMLNNQNTEFSYSGNFEKCYLLVMKWTKNQTNVQTGKMTPDQISFFTDPAIQLFDFDGKEDAGISADVSFFIFSTRGFYSGQLSLRIPNNDYPSVDEVKYDVTRMVKLFLEKLEVSSETEDLESIDEYEDDMSEEEVARFLAEHDHLPLAFTDTFFYNKTEEGIKITFLKNKDLTEIVLPDNVGIVALDSYLFSDCESLNSVIIPEGVKTIGDSAFSDCKSLTSVQLPDSVESIGESAFRSCESLSSITIPKCTVTVGKGAFSWCENIESVIIPESVKEIGDDAFLYCRRLKSVIIKNSKTKIGKNAIPSMAVIDCVPGSTAEQYCKSNKMRYTYNGAEPEIKIDSSNFKKFFKFKEVDGAITITGIKDISLTKITFPEDLNIVAIGDKAFHCSKITEIVFPDTVETIGKQAFQCCKLTQAVFGKATKSISKDAFLQVETLNYVYIPKSTLSICPFAFPYGLKQIKFEVEEGNPVYHSAYGCVIETATKTIIYGSDAGIITDDGSVTKIGDYAFAGKNIDSLSLPASVTEIGETPFTGCINSIAVSEDNTEFAGKGNCLISKKDKALLRGSNTSIIPDDGSVKTISSRAFQRCNGLISITIPDSVTKIGEYAFAWCDNLKTIIIPASVTRIGKALFYNTPVTVHTPKGSPADKYCLENGIPVVND